MGPVGGDTLLLHHEGHVVKGAAVEEVVMDIGCKGGLEKPG
jgi:hypothetical protein